MIKIAHGGLAPVARLRGQGAAPAGGPRGVGYYIPTYFLMFIIWCVM